MSDERFKIKLPTRILAGRLRGEGSIANISRGGLFVRCSAIPEQGETVRLAFEAPDGERISVSGLVWWTTEPSERPNAERGFGVRLLSASKAYERLLAAS